MEKSKFTETEKGETGEDKDKFMPIVFFDIKGIVHKEIVLIGQTVNSAYYCDILWRLHENVQRLLPEFWQKTNGCCITTTHRLTLPFCQGIFDQNNITVVPTHPTHLTFLCFLDRR
jgi:hypothetical protein